MKLAEDKIFSGVAVSIIGLATLTAGALADVSAIGTLQSEAPFQVRSSTDEEFVWIRESDYSWFSGDTVRASRGVAVLNLNKGGGLGFHQGAEATISMNANGRVSGAVLAGKVIYAMPQNSAGMELEAGDFVLTAGMRPTGNHDARRVDVALEGEFVGDIQLLKDGHLKVSVRSGVLDVVQAEAAPVQVTAGETLGLLALPEASAVEVRTEGVVDIIAPEAVGTSEEFQVSWESVQPIDHDFFVLAPGGSAANEFTAAVSATEGQPLVFTAPSSPGNYEIRVIDQASGAIASSEPLIVSGTQSTQSAAAAAGTAAGAAAAAGTATATGATAAAGAAGVGASAGGAAAVGAMTVASGGGAVLLGAQVSDEEDPVSP